MKARTISRLLTVAAVLGLVALAMMVWSLFDPRPIVLVAFMSVGQGLGTLSLLLYGSVVLFDLWTARSLPTDEAQAQADAEGEEQAAAEGEEQAAAEGEEQAEAQGEEQAEAQGEEPAAAEGEAQGEEPAAQDGEVDEKEVPQ